MTIQVSKLVSCGVIIAGSFVLGCNGDVSTSEIEGNVRAISGNPELYTPKPNNGAKQQIAALQSSGQAADADLIRKMIATPQAAWFTQGTPESVEQDVGVVMARARNQGVPVLVAYNIPFRDCAQFSAGGATNAAEYAAWIDGFAKGIGDQPAIVILEPDGLGIIPWFIPYYPPDPDHPYEWCQPTEAKQETAAQDRFDMIKAAVIRLKQQPGVKVYLDGTHASWLGVGEAAHRLILAGIDQAAGFFLNVSNYQTTTNSIHYGNWISSCIAYTLELGSWDASWCSGQYAPDADGVYVVNYSDEQVATVYNDFSWGPAGTTHFLIDTSRNGQGPWTPPAPYDANIGQDWCNPPARGVGLRPTLQTGEPLLDAYLWVKIPGESDGACNRWNPAGGSDPVRGIMDPAAGLWFGDMALELAINAVPAM
jgi:endoglucanase